MTTTAISKHTYVYTVDVSILGLTLKDGTKKLMDEFYFEFPSAVKVDVSPVNIWVTGADDVRMSATFTFRYSYPDDIQGEEQPST